MIRCDNCFTEYENDLNGLNGLNGLSGCPECGYVPGDPPAEPSHLRPGTELGERYIIGGSVGFGGFGITYRAWDKKLSIIVAIKEYYPCGIVNRTPDSEEVVIYAKKREKEYCYGKERFLEEARNMAKFNSESNIINVFEYFEENNTAYIVMEFLNGLPLSSYMRSDGGKIDVDTGIEIAGEIGDALIKIHSKGIVHRDVSPDNIFILLGGGVKLIDFGAARFSQDESRLMTIILKPGFAPPEQYEKINEQGPWTDVYALGATLYYALTGVKPEESTNRKIKDVLPSPRELESSIPENISNAIMKAMAIELQLRYKNVEQFIGDIRSGRKIASVETEKKRRRRKRFIGVVSASAVLAAGITAGVFSWENEKEEETLPDSSILMCYCKSGDEELDSAKENAYLEIIGYFGESFPNVSIELSGYEADEYADMLLSAERQPGIYEYAGTLSSAEPLSLDSIYDGDTAENCTLLNYAQSYYGCSYYLPLSFNAPVIYANTSLSSDDNSIVTDIADFEKMFAVSGAYYSEDARSLFAAEEYAYYASMTSAYYDVAEALPAQYELIGCETDEIYCSYDNVWAATDNGEDCNKAELKFLEFMLNNNAQDALHIRNRCGSLPINDAVLDVYVSVYSDYETFFSNKDNYVIK